MSRDEIDPMEYEEIREGYCSLCRNRCYIKTVDVGIGRYEFWGQVGFHSQLEDVSDCCEADVEETDAIN